MDEIIRNATQQALDILSKLGEDKESFRKLGLTFEEKAFYDILMHMLSLIHICKRTGAQRDENISHYSVEAAKIFHCYVAVSYTHLDVYKRQARQPSKVFPCSLFRPSEIVSKVR